MTPARMLPVRVGVTSSVWSPDPYTKNRLFDPISSTQVRSSASRYATWAQPCSAPCTCGSKRGRVVATALGGAGATQRSAGVLGGEPDVDGLHAAREVRTDRRGDQRVEVLGRGPNAQPDLGGQHERPQVQRVLARRRRHPLVVDGQQLGDRREEQLFGELRHREPGRRAAEACRVGLGAERGDRAVGLPVRLEALEDLLPVVQDHRGGIERQRPVRHHRRVVPAHALGPPDRHHVVGEIPAESGVGQDLAAPHRFGGRGVGGAGELRAHDVRRYIGPPMIGRPTDRPEQLGPPELPIARARARTAASSRRTAGCVRARRRRPRRRAPTAGRAGPTRCPPSASARTCPMS